MYIDGRRTAGAEVFQPVQNTKKYLPNIVKQVFSLACQEGLEPPTS